MMKTLDEFIQYFGSGRQASVSRELTKIYEETIRGTLQEIKVYYEAHTLKGEFVVCVNGMKHSISGS